MRVLAVDTTTERGSLAVVSEDGTLADVRVRTAAGHSRWLLPAVQAALGGLGLEPSALDAFAVTTGPGSFTGLRVGLSSVQGLALACARPCLGVSALAVLGGMASGAGSSGPSESSSVRGLRVLALMNAFRGEVYWAFYEDGTLVSGPSVGPLEQALADARPGTAFVGDAVAGARGRIEAVVPAALFPETELYLASALGRAALVRLEAGEAPSVSQLRPLYLRGADIRLPRP